MYSWRGEAGDRRRDFSDRRHGEGIGLADIIDRCCEWDRTRCIVSPGQAVEALAIRILSDQKALYRVEEFYEGKDVEALFGAGGNRVLGEAISSALKAHDVAVGSVHLDTTSLSVCGEYENQDCENAIQVVLGYSKDRRPDLEQTKFGIGVTRV
ncbi:MAG: DUF4277 domain-containing protein [Clostridia bacterium]|nr:DUF4277 domain-containing protein [Clostridia bacterium]